MADDPEEQRRKQERSRFLIERLRRSNREASPAESVRSAPAVPVNRPGLNPAQKQDVSGHIMGKWDSHNHCRTCRWALNGRECTRRTPCDHCKTWSADKWDLFEFHESRRLKRSSGRKKAAAAVQASLPDTPGRSPRTPGKTTGSRDHSRHRSQSGQREHAGKHRHTPRSEAGDTPRKESSSRKRKHGGSHRESPAKAPALDPNVSAMLEGMKSMQSMMASAMEMFCRQQIPATAHKPADAHLVDVQSGEVTPVYTGEPALTKIPPEPSRATGNLPVVSQVEATPPAQSGVDTAPQVSQSAELAGTEAAWQQLLEGTGAPGATVLATGAGPVNTGESTGVPATQPVNVGQASDIPVGPSGVAIVAEGAPATVVPVRQTGRYDPVLPGFLPVDPQSLAPATSGATGATARPFPLESGLDDRGREIQRESPEERGDSLLDEDEDGARMDWAEESDPVLPRPVPTESDDAVTESLASAAQRQLTFEDAPVSEPRETGSLFRRTKDQIMSMLGGSLVAPPIPTETKRRALSVVTMEGAESSGLSTTSLPFSPYVDEVFRTVDRELRGARSHQSPPTAKALPRGKLLRRPSATMTRYGIPEFIYDPKATLVDVEWDSICRYIKTTAAVPLGHLERFEEDARQLVMIGSYLDVSSAASLEITQKLLASDMVSEPVKDWLNLNLQLQAARGMAIEHMLRIAVTNEANLRLERRDACLASSNISGNTERAVRCSPLFSNYLFGGSLSDIAKRVLDERQQEATATTQKALVDIAGAVSKVAAKTQAPGKRKRTPKSFIKKRIEKARALKSAQAGKGKKALKNKKNRKPFRDQRDSPESQ